MRPIKTENLIGIVAVACLLYASNSLRSCVLMLTFLREASGFIIIGLPLICTLIWAWLGLAYWHGPRQRRRHGITILVLTITACSGMIQIAAPFIHEPAKEMQRESIRHLQLTGVGSGITDFAVALALIGCVMAVMRAEKRADPLPPLGPDKDGINTEIFIGVIGGIFLLHAVDALISTIMQLLFFNGGPSSLISIATLLLGALLRAGLGLAYLFGPRHKWLHILILASLSFGCGTKVFDIVSLFVTGTHTVSQTMHAVLWSGTIGNVIDILFTLAVIGCAVIVMRTDARSATGTAAPAPIPANH